MGGWCEGGYRVTGGRDVWTAVEGEVTDNGYRSCLGTGDRPGVWNLQQNRGERPQRSWHMCTGRTISNERQVGEVFV